MKPDQLPDCHIDENDGYYICYVMVYDDEEHQDIEEREVDGIVEVKKTCRICGEQDIYYPI